MSDETEILLRVKTESAEIKKLEKDFGTLKVQVERSADAAEQLGAHLKMATELSNISKMIAQMASLQASEAQITAEKRAQILATRQQIAEQQKQAAIARRVAAQTNSVATGAGKITPALNSAKSAADGLGFSLGTVLKTMGAIAALRVLTGGFTAAKDATTGGVGFNAQAETATLGIASVLREFNPERFQDFDAAATKSVQIVQQLKIAALQTAAGFDELLEGFQGSAGAMAQANIPIDKQVGLMVRMAQTLTALGIQTRELRQESTALLLGRIDQNARAAKTLGITAADIELAKEQGNLYDFLMSKMSAFGEAANRAASTVTVLQSNLRDAAVQANAAATVGLTEAYRGLLVALTDFVNSDAYKSLAGGFASIATSIVSLAEALLTSSNIANKLSSEGKISEYQKRADSISADLKSATTPEEIAAARSRAKATLINLQADVSALGFDKPPVDAGANFEGGDSVVQTEKVKKFYELQQQIALTKLNLRELVSAADQYGGTLLSGNIADANKKSQTDAIFDGASESRRKEQEALDWLAKHKKATEDRTEAGERSLATDAAQVKKIDERIKLIKDELALDLLKADTAAVYEMTELKANDEIIKLLKEREDAEKRILAAKEKQANETERIAKKEDRDKAEKLRGQLRLEQKIRDATVSGVQDNRYMTDKQKQARLFGMYQAESLALPGAIDRAKKFEAGFPEGSAQRREAAGETQRLVDRQQIGNPTDLQATQPTTMGQDILAQVTQLQNGFMTVADAVGTTLKSAIDSVSESMVGLIQGTMTWGEALSNIGTTIMTTVLQAISRMFAEWIVGRAAAGVASILWSTKEGAADVAAKTPGALLTSISSFGVAAAIGVAALVAALASFDVGGYTRTGSGGKRIAGVVHENEWVAPEWMVSDPFYGRQIAAMEQARSGNLRVNSGMGGGAAVAGGVYGGATPMAGPATSEGGFSQAFFNTKQEAEEWLRTRSGRRVMTDFISQDSFDLP